MQSFYWRILNFLNWSDTTNKYFRLLVVIRDRKNCRIREIFHWNTFLIVKETFYISTLKLKRKVIIIKRYIWQKYCIIPPYLAGLEVGEPDMDNNSFPNIALLLLRTEKSFIKVWATIRYDMLGLLLTALNGFLKTKFDMVFQSFWQKTEKSNYNVNDCKSRWRNAPTNEMIVLVQWFRLKNFICRRISSPAMFEQVLKRQSRCN